jgi:hypothetical protein
MCRCTDCDARHGVWTRGQRQLMRDGLVPPWAKVVDSLSWTRQGNCQVNKKYKISEYGDHTRPLCVTLLHFSISPPHFSFHARTKRRMEYIVDHAESGFSSA